MNRRVVLFIAMSLDGYIARKNGSIDWLNIKTHHLVEDPSYEDFYSTIDTVIMGRTTFDQVINELSPNHYPYADAASYLLTATPAPGKDIWILARQSIIKPLLQQNLIDKFRITIIPTLLVDGIPLFHSIQNKINLKQVDCYERNQLTYLHFIQND